MWISCHPTPGISHASEEKTQELFGFIVLNFCMDFYNPS